MRPPAPVFSILKYQPRAFMDLQTFIDPFVYSYWPYCIYRIEELAQWILLKPYKILSTKCVRCYKFIRVWIFTQLASRPLDSFRAWISGPKSQSSNIQTSKNICIHISVAGMLIMWYQRVVSLLRVYITPYEVTLDRASTKLFSVPGARYTRAYNTIICHLWEIILVCTFENLGVF